MRSSVSNSNSSVQQPVSPRSTAASSSGECNIQYWGPFQLGVKQEKFCLSQKVKQESVTFVPPNKEVMISNMKPFPVNWT